MAYPYKKMDEADFEYIRSVTAPDRVWTGGDIAREYYRDEMPEYGIFPPELYVEVINKEEVSAIGSQEPDHHNRAWRAPSGYPGGRRCGGTFLSSGSR